MNALPNLGEGVPLEVEPHCLHLLAEHPPHISLLRTKQRDTPLSNQDLLGLTDVAQATAEDVGSEIARAQQSTCVSPPQRESVFVVLFPRVEGQDAQPSLALRRRPISLFVSRDSRHRQLSGVNRPRLGELEEVHSPHQPRKNLDFERRAALAPITKTLSKILIVRQSSCLDCNRLSTWRSFYSIALCPQPYRYLPILCQHLGHLRITETGDSQELR